jgi:hypothetical protein
MAILYWTSKPTTTIIIITKIYMEYMMDGSWMDGWTDGWMMDGWMDE